MKFNVKYFCSIVLSVLYLIKDVQAHKAYLGILNPTCVQTYNEIIVKRMLPVIDYKYFNEIKGNTKSFFPRDNNGLYRIEEHPYQVQYGKYCGGALISRQWVLTTAHCRENCTYVLVGSSQRDQGERYNVCAHFVHPLYARTGSKSSSGPSMWNFQLLLLEQPVTLKDNVRPIAIGSTADVVPGETLTVTSWGIRDSKNGPVIVTNGRKMMSPVIENQDCESIYPNLDPESSFCTGVPYTHTDTCQAGPGGAVYSRKKLVGLISFAPAECSAERTTVVANVPAIRSWIREITLLPY